jgi:hypothetical protein
MSSKHGMHFSHTFWFRKKNYNQATKMVMKTKQVIQKIKIKNLLPSETRQHARAKPAIGI